MKCAEWFRYVSCVIVINSKNQVFLGKRPAGVAESGKWAILGGSGAFGESSSRRDFARKELEYDVKLKYTPEKLEHFHTLVIPTPDGLVIEDYFIYKEDGKVKVSGKEKAPVEGRWFLPEELDVLKGRGEIAFDNYNILREYMR